MSVNEARLAIARELGRLLATAEGRKYFSDNGYASMQSIVAVGYNETIGDVTDRTRTHEPPVTLATINNDGELLMMTMKPSKGAPAFGTSQQNVSPKSTVGMLFEAVVLAESGTRFQITEWDVPAVAMAMPSTRTLLHA